MTVYELHDEVEDPVALACLVNRDDVGMLDSRCGPRLGAEALPVGIVLGDVWTDQLQRDDTVELDVASAEDDAHAAAGEFPLDQVAGEGVPGVGLGSHRRAPAIRKITGSLGCVFTIRLPNPLVVARASRVRLRDRIRERPPATVAE